MCGQVTDEQQEGAQWRTTGEEWVIYSAQIGSRREETMFKRDPEVADGFAKGRQ